MKKRTVTEVMDALGEELILEFDQIARVGHALFKSYPAEIQVELDARAQAACTYSHMLAEADRRFIGRHGIRTLEINGLKLWMIEEADVVIRLKKMDEDGRTRSYPTKQARDFDRQLDLPDLPSPPLRLTAGYLLDPSGSVLVRSQIAMPISHKRTDWCVAIVPAEVRVVGEPVWIDVTRQASL